MEIEGRERNKWGETCYMDITPKKRRNVSVKAKKNLGQHFLTDEGIARKIAETISCAELEKCKAEVPLSESEVARLGRLPVLEIGPGMGVLTKYLMESGRELTAVELDGESVEYLARVYPQLKVIEGDFLKMNLSEIYQGEFALIGNYPYNISSQIFFKVLDYREQIPVVSGMLQKEVAERICSGPGSKVYGILSVLLQAWYDCEYLFNVSPGVFNPPPKVMSGVLRLVRNKRESLGVDEKFFKTVVKTAFGQRRKTLRNSLSSLLANASGTVDEETLKLRPERLSVEQFIELAKALTPKISNQG